jgi:hypothetical protein
MSAITGSTIGNSKSTSLEKTADRETQTTTAKRFSSTIDYLAPRYILPRIGSNTMA